MFDDYRDRQQRFDEAISALQDAVRDLRSGFNELNRGLEPAKSIANACIEQYRGYDRHGTATDELLLPLHDLIEQFPDPPTAALDEVLTWLDRAECFKLRKTTLPKGYGRD